MVKRGLTLGILVIMMPFTVVSSYAGNDSTMITASVRVLPVAEYEVMSEVNQLVITDRDIQRGYLDVSNAMVISVKTNSRYGCIVQFFITTGVISGFTVSDENNDYHSGSEFHLPYEREGFVRKGFDIRFFLMDNAKPGTYEWPVSLMITAM